MNEQGSADVVKWYTRARKFPQLIGKTPDGTRIWGGPYTVTQAVAAGGLAFVLYNTMGLWGQFGFLGNLFVFITAVVVVVKVLGQIPLGSRNPLLMAAGLSRAFTAPTTGRLGGRPVRIKPPHRVQHNVVVALDDLSNEDPKTMASAAVPEPSSTAEPGPAAPRRQRRSRPKRVPSTKKRASLGGTGVTSPPTPEIAPQAAAPALSGGRALSGVQALLASQPPTKTTTNSPEGNR